MRINVHVQAVIGAALLLFALAACEDAITPTPTEEPRRVVTVLTEEHQIKTDSPPVESGLATASASTPFTITWEIPGTLEANTINIYQVTVNQAGRLTARTTGSSGPDTYGYIKDPEGTTLAEDDDGGGGNNFMVTAQVGAGSYHIWVKGASAGITGRYVLRVDFTAGGTSPPADGDDHGNTRSAATRVATGSTTAGTLTAGDVDYFAITVSQSGTLTVNTSGSTDTHGTLENASGGTLATDDDGGSGSNFRASASVGAGTYYVKVRGYSGSTAGDYQLHVTFAASGEPPDGDDHGNTRSAATRVATGSTTAGTLTAGDVDYFAVTVSQSGTLTVNTSGSTDTHGTLENASGGTLATDDDGGSGSNFRVSASVGAGTHYVKVRGYSGSTTGDYRLHVTFTPDDTPPTTTRDCPECPLMVEVPAGSYVMGSPPTEQGRWSDEGPQHTVTIGYRLAVGVYEVTFAEWDACVAAGGCNGYRPSDRGWGRGARPVINVSWDDAQAYVAWLSRKTGRSYRLLSESEWEYVARAGTTTRYHTGDTITSRRANFGKSGRTVEVGSYPANAFGLHDVHGNVWEWTQDCWNDSYRGAPANGSAWESGTCARRVVRSGSWWFGLRDVRSANRARSSPGFHHDYGIRVARTLDDTSPPDGDHGNTRSTATSVATPSSTAGTLTAGDVDYFAITVSQSGTLTVNTSGGTDTYGTLENASGGTLVTNDDGGSGSNFQVSAAVGAGTYYVKVRGYSGSTTGAYQLHVTLTTVGTTLGKATNPNPSHGATNRGLNTSVSWTAGSGATKHRVYFGTDPTPDSGEYKGEQSGTSYNPPGNLSAGTTYYWRIDSKNNQGATRTGDVWRFTTVGATLGQATNPNPSHGATNRGLNTSVSWTAGSGATKHRVYFGTDPTPDSGEYKGEQSGTSYNPPGNLSADTTYYWRIDSKNNQGATRTGDVWRFTTVGATLGQATNPNPSHGATNRGLNTSVSWTAGSGATKHRVYFGTDPTPDSGEYKGEQSGTSYNPPGNLSADTTYYWRIDSKNNQGATRTGDVWRFRTSGSPPGGTKPGRATNPYPSHGATNRGLNTSVSWTAGSGATKHRVYFGTDPTPDSGEYKGEQSGTSYNPPGNLSAGTTYYWRIDEKNSHGTTEGHVWRFTTGDVPDKGSSPFPSHGATGVSLNVDPFWTAGERATRQRIYFGTDPTPDSGEYMAEIGVSVSTFSPGSLAQNTTYYWRIDQKNNFGTTQGDVWRFVTRGKATNPSPAHAATGVVSTKVLSWNAGGGASKHRVYFGTDSTPDSGEYKGEVSSTSYDPTGHLDAATTYYWRIDAEDAGGGFVTGDVWRFTTGRPDLVGGGSVTVDRVTGTRVYFTTTFSWKNDGKTPVIPPIKYHWYYKILGVKQTIHKATLTGNNYIIAPGSTKTYGGGQKWFFRTGGRTIYMDVEAVTGETETSNNNWKYRVSSSGVVTFPTSLDGADMEVGEIFDASADLAPVGVENLGRD